MSRDEAHQPRAAGRRRTTPAPATPRPPDEPARPQPPLFTARTDETAGVVRTRGHLDEVGAEVLCGILTALQASGHRRIAVLLGTATVADADAHALLFAHARRLRADGVRLEIG